MANHRIDIDPMDPESVDAAFKQVKQIQKEFGKKLKLFMEEIAKIGAKAAREGYGGGSVKVTAEKISDDEWVIVANHEAIVFFEFGAGKATNENSRYAKEMPFPVYVGSYSDANGGQFQATGYEFWEFGGRPYERIPQRAGMQKAYEAIISQWKEVAKRVFG